jgi:hypothetical protein
VADCAVREGFRMGCVGCMRCVGFGKTETALAWFKTADALEGGVFGSRPTHWVCGSPPLGTCGTCGQQRADAAEGTGATVGGGGRRKDGGGGRGPRAAWADEREG